MLSSETGKQIIIYVKLRKIINIVNNMLKFIANISDNLIT